MVGEGMMGWTLVLCEDGSSVRVGKISVVGQMCACSIFGVCDMIVR